MKIEDDGEDEWWNGGRTRSGRGMRKLEEEKKLFFFSEKLLRNMRRKGK